MEIEEKRARIIENVAAVRAAIAAACKRAGRYPADVQLVAVTKYVDVPTIRLLLEAGICDLGENRVQQLQQRAGELGADLTGIGQPAAPPIPRWHMIGHLQRNKVKALLPYTRVIHSVDSVRLGQEIERHAAAIDAVVDVLVEVNISGEGSKEGVTAADALLLIRELRQLAHLRLCGLMTMAPLADSAEAARPTFAGLRRLLDQLHADQVVKPEFRQLSMGMSHDLEVAVEEGATMVRVGSRLFEGITAGL